MSETTVGNARTPESEARLRQIITESLWPADIHVISGRPGTGRNAIAQDALKVAFPDFQEHIVITDPNIGGSGIDPDALMNAAVIFIDCEQLEQAGAASVSASLAGEDPMDELVTVLSGGTVSVPQKFMRPRYVRLRNGRDVCIVISAHDHALEGAMVLAERIRREKAELFTDAENYPTSPFVHHNV